MGVGTSSVDGDQLFSFGKAFSNTVNRFRSPDEHQGRIHSSGDSLFADDLHVNRSNDIDGSEDFYYMAIGFKGAAIEMKQALGHVCRSLAIMAGDTAQMMVRAAVVALVPCIESRIVSRRAAAVDGFR